jgi:alkylation response protein AidB-like acyl-CoA dehydrogenase
MTMDFGFTEEQEMLRMECRKFLEKECPTSLVRKMEKDERGYPIQLWRKMADLAWMGLIIPKEYGGSGRSFQEMTILLEEMGRVLLPGPFFSTVILGVLPILAAGTDEQKREFLPKVAKGELILTLAFTEPGANYGAADIRASAVRDNGDFLINGTKLFVPNAHVADYILCVTRTNDGSTPQEGITIFAVKASSPGIVVNMLDTMADDKQCEVVFDNAKVPMRSIIGQLNQGWEIVEKVLAEISVAQCALMLGGAQRVLEMTAEYARTRMQFSQPIGAFQATAHRTADQMIDVDVSKHLVYQAAYRISEGLPCSREASIAKAWINEAYQRVCLEAHQTHGALGYTADYGLGLYTRRANAWKFSFGDTDFHLEVVARERGL